jgi:calcineurin-like phosphoesterase family protein
MTSFFTADDHYSHNNILKYCNRPFQNVHEMNVALTDRWNAVIKDKDIVYVLGDFCFGNPELFLNKLNGRKILIRGSHDKRTNGFEAVYDLYEFREKDIRITLCHYAMRRWAHSHHGAYHLFGHSHGKLEPFGNSFDVGVDCWEFRPISLDEVVEEMKHQYDNEDSTK